MHKNKLQKFGIHEISEPVIQYTFEEKEKAFLHN